MIMNMIFDYEFDTENIDMDTVRSINHLNKKGRSLARYGEWLY